MVLPTLLFFTWGPADLACNTEEFWVVRERMSKRKAPRAQSYMEVESVPKTPIKLGPDIKVKIGQQLRAMYSDVVNQGVPDRFSEILHRLDQADQASDPKKTDEGDK
jgi:hypothetical protein